MRTQRDEIFEYARDYFGTSPDHPWQSDPEYAVLRHEKSKKWYGLIMRISRRKLGLDSDDMTDVLNVKCEPGLIGSLTMRSGFFPAYHMSKEHWLTVILDGTVPTDEIIGLLRLSYEMTEG